MGQAGLEPRRRAVAMMTGVTGDHEPLHMLDSLLNGLEAGERARANRLATESLRWSPRADRALGPFLRARPDEQVLNILRLALYEIGEGDTPAHAAVNAAVELAPKRARGMVNAVLRNVGRSDTKWEDLPIPPAPKWLRKRLKTAWGKDVLEALEAAHAAGASLDLTVKSDPEIWAERLGGQVLSTGSVRLATQGQVSALEGFEDGAWWVQDAAAALPVKLLDPKPGARVLDLCAAPGGKTMQLATMGAKVTALDHSESRLKRLTQNLKRTGLDAEVVVADALEWEPSEPFDAILLDAPCSASGTLRRHPDLAHAKNGSELETLVPLQKALLDRALSWLVPGGALVYCTCSLFPEEGEHQLADALSRHDDVSVDDVLPKGFDLTWCADDGGLRTRPDMWPESGGLDGFFMVRLRKPA